MRFTASCVCLAVVDAHVDDDDTSPRNGCWVVPVVSGAHEVTSGGDATTTFEVDFCVGFSTALAVVGALV